MTRLVERGECIDDVMASVEEQYDTYQTHGPEDTQ